MYINVGMLISLGRMNLERILSMLKMFATQGESALRYSAQFKDCNKGDSLSGICEYSSGGIVESACCLVPHF